MLTGAGLAGLFLTGLLASTLLPLASEPVLVAYFLTSPDVPRWMPVTAIGIGNTLGGVITYLMGRGLRVLWMRWRSDDTPQGRVALHARASIDRFGPFALVMSWLPVIGDPLCLIAGSLRLSFWACVFWIALGKFGRYATLAVFTPVA